nr:hypothetical protein [Proteus myxofaciens]
MNYPYMVDRVNSDTELVISQPATFTVKNTGYSINLTEPNTYSDANNRMTAIASDTTYFLRAMDQWMMNNGVVTVELANGQKVTLDSIKKMQGDIENRASLVSAETQRFKGQVTSYAGMYIAIDDTFKDYFGVMKPERNYPFRLYGEVAGAGRDYYFPPNKQGEVALQQFDDFRNKDINDIGSYSWGVSSGLFTARQLWGGNSEVLGGIINIRNWRDASGYSGCFQLLSIGEYLYYKTGSASVGNFGTERRIITADSTGKLIDSNNQSEIPKLTQFIRAYGGGLLRWGVGSFVGYNGSDSWGVNTFNNETMSITFSLSGALTSYRLLSDRTTTVDSNGFIKKASPIININPDGTYATNDESEGATVTRISEGEYLIEGVLGFNADAGWGGVDGGIEIPLDVNKQPLIWVDSKILADGSIRVRTYHRTHPNAPKFARNDIEGYSDGDLIDIPDGRFISVRVQMPEQSIYNVKMREMEEAQKAEEERRQKEEEMKAQFGLGENDMLL